MENNSPTREPYDGPLPPTPEYAEAHPESIKNYNREYRCWQAWSAVRELIKLHKGAELRMFDAEKSGPVFSCELVKGIGIKGDEEYDQLLADGIASSPEESVINCLANAMNKMTIPDAPREEPKHG